MADRRALVVRCCVLAYANTDTGHPCAPPAPVLALNSGTVTELSLSPRDFGRKGPGEKVPFTPRQRLRPRLIFRGCASKHTLPAQTACGIEPHSVEWYCPKTSG